MTQLRHLDRSSHILPSLNRSACADFTASVSLGSALTAWRPTPSCLLLTQRTQYRILIVDRGPPEEDSVTYRARGRGARSSDDRLPEPADDTSAGAPDRKESG